MAHEQDVWLKEAKTVVLPKKAHENHMQRNTDCVAATNSAIRGVIKIFGARTIYLDTINQRLKAAYCHLPNFEDLQKPLLPRTSESDTNENDGDSTKTEKDNNNNSSNGNNNNNNNNKSNPNSPRSSKKRKTGKNGKESKQNNNYFKKSKRSRVIDNDTFESNENYNRVFSLYHYEGKLEFIQDSMNESNKIISGYQGVDLVKCTKKPTSQKQYNFKAVNWFNQQRTKISGKLAKDFLQQFKLRYIDPNVKPTFKGIVLIAVIAEILKAKTHFPQTKQCDTVHGEGLHDGKLRDWINSELSDLRISIDWPKLDAKKNATNYAIFKSKVIDELERVYDELEDKLHAQGLKKKNNNNSNSQEERKEQSQQLHQTQQNILENQSKQSSVVPQISQQQWEQTLQRQTIPPIGYEKPARGGAHIQSIQSMVSGGVNSTVPNAVGPFGGSIPDILNFNGKNQFQALDQAEKIRKARITKTEPNLDRMVPYPLNILGGNNNNNNIQNNQFIQSIISSSNQSNNTFTPLAFGTTTTNNNSNQYQPQSMNNNQNFNNNTSFNNSVNNNIYSLQSNPSFGKINNLSNQNNLTNINSLTNPNATLNMRSVTESNSFLDISQNDINGGGTNQQFVQNTINTINTPNINTNPTNLTNLTNPTHQSPAPSQMEMPELIESGQIQWPQTPNNNNNHNNNNSDNNIIINHNNQTASPRSEHSFQNPNESHHTLISQQSQHTHQSQQTYHSQHDPNTFAKTPNPPHTSNIPHISNNLQPTPPIFINNNNNNNNINNHYDGGLTLSPMNHKNSQMGRITGHMSQSHIISAYGGNNECESGTNSVNSSNMSALSDAYSTSYLQSPTRTCGTTSSTTGTTISHSIGINNNINAFDNTYDPNLDGLRMQSPGTSGVAVGVTTARNHEFGLNVKMQQQQAQSQRIQDTRKENSNKINDSLGLITTQDQWNLNSLACDLGQNGGIAIPTSLRKFGSKTQPKTKVTEAQNGQQSQSQTKQNKQIPRLQVQQAQQIQQQLQQHQTAMTRDTTLPSLDAIRTNLELVGNQVNTWENNNIEINNNNISSVPLSQPNGINWSELISTQTNINNNNNNVNIMNGNDDGNILNNDGVALPSLDACGDGAGLHLEILDDPQCSNDDSGGLSMLSYTDANSNNNTNSSNDSSGNDENDDVNDNSNINGNIINNINNVNNNGVNGMSNVNNLNNINNINNINNLNNFMNTSMGTGLSFNMGSFGNIGNINNVGNVDDNTFLGMPMSMDSLDNFGINQNSNNNNNNNTNLLNSNLISMNSMNSVNSINMTNSNGLNNGNNNTDNNNNNLSSQGPRLTSLCAGLEPGKVDFNEGSLSQVFSQSLSLKSNQ